MTYYLAARCGLVGCKKGASGGGPTEVDAGEFAAWSNQYFDVNPKTKPSKDPSGHFPVSEAEEINKLKFDNAYTARYGKASDAWGNEIPTVRRDSPTANKPFDTPGDTGSKGRGIHTVQDSFSHEGLTGPGGHVAFGNDPDNPGLNADSMNKAMQMAQRTYELLGKMMKDLQCPPCQCKEPWAKVQNDVKRMFEAAGSGDEASRAQSWINEMGKQKISVPAFDKGTYPGTK